MQIVKFLQWLSFPNQNTQKPQLVYLQIFRPIFSSSAHCSCEKSQQSKTVGGWILVQLLQPTSQTSRPQVLFSDHLGAGAEQNPHLIVKPTLQTTWKIDFLSVVHHIIMTFNYNICKNFGIGSQSSSPIIIMKAVKRISQQIKVNKLDLLQSKARI